MVNASEPLTGPAKVATAPSRIVIAPDPPMAPLKVTLLDLVIVIDPLSVIVSARALEPTYDCEIAKPAPFAMAIEPALSAPPANAKLPALRINAPLGLFAPPEPERTSEPPLLSETVAPAAFKSSP